MKSLLERKKPDCAECKKCLVDHGNELHTEYLNLVSRGGLKVPSLELLHYTATSFGILDLIESLVRNSNVGERYACEHILKLFGPSPEFACNAEHHNDIAAKVANRIIVNIYFNNAQKESKDAKRKDNLAAFKVRQRKKPE